MSSMDEIAKAHELLEAGAITQDEFESFKSSLLAGARGPALLGDKQCQRCGARFGADADACPECGHDTREHAVSAFWSEPEASDGAIETPALDLGEGSADVDKPMGLCSCGHQLEPDDVFCPECGREVDEPFDAADASDHDHHVPLTATARSTRPSRGKIIAFIVCGMAVLAIVLVVGTKNECVLRRTDIGEFSYYSEMMAGANGTDVQNNLVARTRCPLGFAYSQDMVCPVHGALTSEDRQRVFKNTRGVYGY